LDKSEHGVGDSKQLLEARRTARRAWWRHRLGLRPELQMEGARPSPGFVISDLDASLHGEAAGSATESQSDSWNDASNHSGKVYLNHVGGADKYAPSNQAHGATPTEIDASSSVVIEVQHTVQTKQHELDELAAPQKPQAGSPGMGLLRCGL